MALNLSSGRAKPEEPEDYIREHYLGVQAKANVRPFF